MANLNRYKEFINLNIKRTILFILIYTSYLIVTRFATIDDWAFNTIRHARYVEFTSHLSINDSIPFFTLLCVIFSKIIRLNYEQIISLPLLAPIYFISIYLLIKKLHINKYNCSVFIITALWLMYHGLQPTFFPHSIGYGLFIFLALLVYIHMEKKTDNRLYLGIIIVITAINLTSYNHMVQTIIFLYSIIILNVFPLSKKIHYKKISSFLYITIFSLTIYFLISNHFQVAFKAIVDRVSSPTHTYGIYKLLSKFNVIFFEKEISALSKYEFVGSVSRAPLYLFWYIIILISITFFVILVILKVKLCKKISDGEMIISGLIFPALFKFFIYNILGQFSLNSILPIGILTYPILLEKRSKLIKNGVITVIIILIGIGTYMEYSAYIDESYGGQTDRNNFKYFESPSKWFNTYRKIEVKTYTDELTRGYITQDAFSHGKYKSYIPDSLTVELVLSLLDSKNYSFDPPLNNKNIPRNIIFNYKADSINFSGWYKIIPWNNNYNKINNILYLNSIYTSSKIIICTT